MKVAHKYTKASGLTGKVSTRTITFDPDDFMAWEQGTNIQDAMPYLSADDREFMMTGITPEEWTDTFGDEGSEAKPNVMLRKST